MLPGFVDILPSPLSIVLLEQEIIILQIKIQVEHLKKGRCKCI